MDTKEIAQGYEKHKKEHLISLRNARRRKRFLLHERKLSK